MNLQSDSLDALAPALAKAQSEMNGAQKSAKNPHLNARYADLASVRDAVRGPLASHGFSVVQTVIPRPKTLVYERVVEQKGREVRSTIQVLASVRTTLLHSSGQWIAGEQPIAGDWGDPQKIGSAITYARRYGLAAICGIAQEDDDGHSASHRPPPPRDDRIMPASTLPEPNRGRQLREWAERNGVLAELEQLRATWELSTDYRLWTSQTAQEAYPLLKAKRDAKKQPQANGSQK